MSVSGTGRFFSDSGMESGRGDYKRARVERAVPELGLFMVGLVEEDALASKNVIWMNRFDIQMLYPFPALRQMARIANRIFPVAECRGLCQGMIGINPIQRQDAKNAVSLGPQGEMLLISPVRDFYPFPRFSHIRVGLRSCRPFSDKIVIERAELQEYFQMYFKDQIMTAGQRLYVGFRGGMEAYIEECHSLCGSEFGFFSEDTELLFVHNPREQITIVDDIYEEEVERYCFTISLDHPETPGSIALPLRVHFASLKKQVLNKFSSFPFVEGTTIEIPHRFGGTIRVKFDEVFYKRDPIAREESNLIDGTQRQKGFRLSERSNLNFSYQKADLVLTENVARFPECMRIKVIKIYANPSGSSEDEHWIERCEVIDALMSRTTSYLLGEEYDLVLQSGRFRMKIVSIISAGQTLTQNSDALQPLWKFGMLTKVDLAVASHLNINLIDKQEPIVLKRIVLQASYYGDQTQALTKETLGNIFEAHQPKKIALHQRIHSRTSEGDSIQFRVEDWDFPADESPQNKSSVFGVIEKDTAIDFIAEKTSDLLIIDRIFDHEIEEMQFSLELKKSKRCSHWEKPPMRMDANDLADQVKKALVRYEYLLLGKKEKIPHPSGYDILVNFGQAKLTKGSVSLSNQEIREKHEYGYRMRNDTRIRLLATSDIALTKGDPKQADSISFTIKAQVENEFDKRNPISGNWISMEEFKNQFLAERSICFENEQFIIELSTGKFQISVVKGRTKENAERQPSRYVKQWRISQETEFILPSNERAKIYIIKDQEAKPVKKMTVEVSRVSEKPQNPLAAEPLHLKKEELTKLMLENCRKQMLTRQSIIASTEHHQKIELMITGMLFSQDESSSAEKKGLGIIQDETEIEFVQRKNSSIFIEEPIKLLDIADPIGYFENLGLGGIEKQLQQLHRIFYLRSPALRKQSEKLGLKPVRGALFYGPPGTGKTTLARHLGAILGCNGDRFQKVTSTEILSKWVGENEENLRGLFAPALKAQQELGKESPLHIIVFDELDAILGHRGSEVNKWGDRLVNQFLGLIDGLEQMDNVLVIGLTNRKDQIDPAVMRPGRLELHIELGLPPAEGRRKIFTIHLKPLIDNEKLDQSVDMDSLVAQTDQFSGADIEGLIRKAAEFPLERLTAFKGTEEEMDTCQDGKISMNDFLDALQVVKRSREREMDPDLQSSLYS